MQVNILDVDRSTEIVTLDDANEFQRITDTYDELVVSGCLDAAIDLVEQWLNRKLYPTQVMLQEENFSPEFELSFPKVSSVVSQITAQNEELEDFTFNINDYWKFDDVTSSIRFKASVYSELEQYKNFRITYTCGYCPDTNPVPTAVKHAILMTASTLYEFREDAVTGTQINNVPLQAQRLIAVHRVRPRGM